MIESIDLNIPAVLVASVTVFLLGGVWYSAFGRSWMRALGINRDDIREANLSMTKALVGSAVSSAVMVFGVSLFVSWVQPESWPGVLLLAVVAWAALSMGPMFKQVMWEDRPVTLLAIDGGYELVSLLIAAGVLFAWR